MYTCGIKVEVKLSKVKRQLTGWEIEKKGSSRECGEYTPSMLYTCMKMTLCNPA